MTITAATLQNDTDWNDLQAALEGTFASISAVRGVLARAREIGAASVILEGDYLDRDFSAEFAQFYARVFKRFPKLCKRFHFFAEDVVPLLNHPDPQKIAEDLNSLSAAGKYLGYIVARPVAHAPLCRVVLAQPASPPDLKVDLLVRSEFVVHLLGSVLSVTSTPFTQQDARVGACAQAAADSGDCGQAFRLNAARRSDRRRPPVPTKAAGVSLPA